MIGLLLGIIYLAFVSLGLPDALLGAAWPTIYGEFGVPVSYMGILSMLIAFATVISSLLSDRLTRKLGTGKVTAISVALTAVALFGFSTSHSFALLCVWAIPYGLGAGSVDAALNNYVALHYASRHSSWLHCMWGVGAALGPYIMGYALTGGQAWNMGYRYIAFIQVALTAVLFLSLPLWKKCAQRNPTQMSTHPHGKALSLRQTIGIPGAKAAMATCFCYCALEQSAGLWASSYLVLSIGISAEKAASFASLFYIGITVGRAISGFVTFKLNDTQMIRLGQVLVALGIVTLFLPFGESAAIAGLVLLGVGCAPIYPCILHATPSHFGAERSQAMVGVQMASAYAGICLMPPLFGLLANSVGAALLPLFLAVTLVLMILVHEKLVKQDRIARVH